MASFQREPRSPSAAAPSPPVLRTTRYDKVTSALSAVVIGLVIAVVWLFIAWAGLWRTPVETIAEFEMVDGGGYLDGSPDETLRLDAPEDLRDDPAVEEAPTESEVDQTLENVVELADQATQQVPEQSPLEPDNTGDPGRAEGTGNRPLGFGPGTGGFPPEDRWFIVWNDNESIDEYAKQLDFFGIQLAVIKRGGMTLVKGLSSPAAQTTFTTVGAGQFTFTPRGGRGLPGDRKLLEKAGVNIGDGQVRHVYPTATVGKLAAAERAYRGRPPEQIHRTYFSVRGTLGKYEFYVTKQTYLK